ncbi:MAG: alpha/beta hydrolase-fold protein [Chloroflexota bacterium]
MSKQIFTSPRLDALRQVLEAGKNDVVDAFWDEISQQGAPLIEPVPDNLEQSLVTFVWRGTAETKNVVVLGDLTSWDFAANQMTRLAETNLWYRSYRMRNDLRTTYLLAENDSLIPFSETTDYAVRTAHFQFDPLNPHTFVYLKDEEGINYGENTRSVLELPAALPQPWAAFRADAPAGKIEEHRLRSEILDNERRVWVYTPPNYTPDGRPYGLLLGFDGWGLIKWVNLPTILDNLLAENRIPPLVAILPDSLGETRSTELGCYPPFDDFLIQELLPWARQIYHITDDPSQSVIGGISLGGMASAYTSLRHPDIFGSVLSLSGAFFYSISHMSSVDWLVRQFVGTEKLPLRFYMDAGLLETKVDPEEGISILMGNRHMRDVLDAKGYSVHHAEFNGGHNPVCWRGTFADGLLALIDKKDN